MPGESQGLVGYCPYVHKESDATKHARALFYLIQMKEKKERRKERETERRVTSKRVTSKRKRVLIHATTWMNFDNILLKHKEPHIV